MLVYLCLFSFDWFSFALDPSSGNPTDFKELRIENQVNTTPNKAKTAGTKTIISNQKKQDIH